MVTSGRAVVDHHAPAARMRRRATSCHIARKGALADPRPVKASTAVLPATRVGCPSGSTLAACPC
jgi:hypothetical protein